MTHDTGISLRTLTWLAGLVLAAAAPLPAVAGSFFFSTGNPDGLLGALSRPAGPGVIETETADDFTLGQATRIGSATFTGLIPLGAPVTAITDVEIELYHVFPKGSANPPSGNVPTRVNSPADVEIGAATRDGLAGTLSFIGAVLNPSFTVANTVINGVNKSPNQFTGGEGPATGEEVMISVIFNTPIILAPGHYFFRPEAQLSSGGFLWLSAPKPIVAPGTPFSPDLQSWIRNGHLAPDWLRIGTDITHRGPFDQAFSLAGNAVPELSTWTMMILGFAGVALRLRRRADDRAVATPA